MEFAQENVYKQNLLPSLASIRQLQIHLQKFEGVVRFACACTKTFVDGE